MPSAPISLSRSMRSHNWSWEMTAWIEHHPSCASGSYREFFDYFDGRIGYDEAVELIKRNSRRYAKRQLTWFRRDPEIRWFRPDDDAAMINYIDFGKS